MGVKGLWELLAPVGRRVSVETLAGKKLAIDASIWMVQFMKAMRDDKSGDMIKNAHILGFLRRILKLLFLRTKPVFVFDGATPSLKRRTIAARRRHRQDAQAKVRKTAEKLLLNHLKSKTLLQQQHQQQHIVTNEDRKGKRKIDDGNETESNGTKRMHAALTQEAIDEMLAASLAAEEEEDFSGSRRATTSVGDDDEEDEEMVIPVTSNKIDPAVLASLPPSMQLDLLVQMRERTKAENRQKYQKLKKSPVKFSELQIQSYLKTVAFRREIDQVQKSAAGSGLGGMQGSRIASEANREFIFSSSFTGDKETLSAKAIEKPENLINQSAWKAINFESVKSSLFPNQSESLAESTIHKAADDFRNDVEMYHDKNGRARVSNLRALGIRMTRDLQRNLDLMKEYEDDFIRGDVHTDLLPEEASTVEGTFGSSKHNSTNAENSRSSETITHEGDKRFGETSVPEIKAPIEISFVHDDGGNKDADDDLFLELASEPYSSFLSTSLINPGSSTNNLETECQWEEGKIDEMEENEYNSQSRELKSSLAEEDNFEEVEWEEGGCDYFDVEDSVSQCQESKEKVISKRLLEEDADVQEAIRRSLQDIELQKASTTSSIYVKSRVDQSPVLSPQNFACEKNSSTPQLPTVTNSERISSPPVTVNEKTIGSEENFAQYAHEDSRERMYHKDENKGTEYHLNNDKEQCTDISGQVLLEPSCSAVPREDISGEHPNFHFKTANNTDDSTPANDCCQQTKTNESCYSMARKDGSKLESLLEEQSQSLSEKRSQSLLGEQSKSLLEEHAETLQKDVLENNNRSNHTVEIGNQDDIGYRNVVSDANIDGEISLLRQERIILEDEQKKLERNAESVNSEMFAECQELLQMFGLPYIIAPMEAEAQCAYMEMSNLVDGVVTDDSDVFLFGARNVYKNIFDERKYVETYLMKDVETELGLNRETLIQMALLLGSDYTEGVSGIGIVNAIEVVRAFPEEDGFQKFREWVQSPDPSILDKFNSHTGNNSKKKTSKSGNNDNTKVPSSEEVAMDVEKSDDNSLHAKEIFMQKHRNISKNWHFPSSFPSKTVTTAYISPRVDNSAEPFSWGKPDLVMLRKLCWERFGWDNKKADELLVPVLKEYNKHETQLRLEAFYSFNERFAKVRSQRIKKALKGITGKGSANVVSDDELGHAAVNESEIKGKKMKKASKKPTRQKNEGENTESDSNTVKKRGRAKGKKELPADEIPATSVIRRSGRRRNNVKYGGEEEESLDENERNNEGGNIHSPGTELLPKTDYIMSGGGFCVDENEEESNDISPGMNPSTVGGFCTEENKEDESVQRKSQTMNEKGEVDLGLRAMPSLRKRRKNN